MRIFSPPQRKRPWNTIGSTNKVRNTIKREIWHFIFILRIYGKSHGLRSQSPAFSRLFFKTSSFSCFGNWQVCQDHPCYKANWHGNQTIPCTRSVELHCNTAQDDYFENTNIKRENWTRQIDQEE